MTAQPEDILTGPDKWAWMEYERNLMVRNRSARTIQSYGEAALQLAAFIAPTPLTGASRAQVENYLLHVREAHSVGSQMNRFRSLRAMYAWWADEDIIPKSPVKRIGAPSGDQKVPQVLTDLEVAALRRAVRAGKSFAGYRDAAILELWLSPGSPRLTEMAGLTIHDVNVSKSATVLVHGKGSKDRLIPPSDAACAAILRYLRHRAAHKLAARTDAMWLGERPGFGARGLGQMLDKRAGQAGTGHVHPHQLRHTAWHNWRMAGGDIDDGMILWGWSQVDMALMYGRSAAIARALQAGRQMGRAS
jgi:site-specific recombinase XerD